MATTYLPMFVTASTPPRGGGEQPEKKFFSQTARATFAWGISPGEATITYIGNAPITRGAQVLLQFGAHFFGGICRSDTSKKSAGGANRELRFLDFRDFLTWDYTFCAFNKEYVRTVNGVRTKRYWHIYPGYDFDNWIKTFTDAPLQAWEIVAAILGARVPGLSGGIAGGTIGTPWTWDLTGGGQFPLGVLGTAASPVILYDFDALGGKRLDSALSEICSRAGTVLTLISTPQNLYQLRFTRKGYGTFANPLFPTNSDDRIYGEALSGNATNVRVLGDRNRYQLLDVSLIPDWSSAWEELLTVDVLIEDIFRRGTKPGTAIRYNAYAGDTEEYLGRQDAAARAKSITVREYVDLRNAVQLAGEPTGDGNRFADTRKFAGRSRMDMPAALYLQTILLRAFRPDLAGITNAAGQFIPLESLDVVSEQICQVSYDPASGAMFQDATQPADGNGLAIIKGYQVSADLWQHVKSDQFNPALFSSANATWAAAPFQIDDSGEGVKFIIFDEPVFSSDNLLTLVDGHAVLNANFTLTIPPVRAALTFEAERYSQWFSTLPNASRDTVETASSLRREIAVNGTGTFEEVTYADGKYAIDKAQELANAALLRQYVYAEGGLKLIWKPEDPPSSFGVQLASLIDRVEITTGPQGTWERVDFTTERQRDGFEPERDLERRTLQNTLFPGQQQLREEAAAHRKLSAIFRQTPPRLLEFFTRLITGQLNPGEYEYVTFADPGAFNLRAGTAVWKKPVNVANGGYNLDTRATYPTAVGTSEKVFLGVTVRDDEDATRAVIIQRSPGRALALVQGPVAAQDDLGLAAGAAYLAKGGSPSVGKALQDITGATIQLINVQFGAGGGQGGALNYRGDYVASAPYSVGDIVRVKTGAWRGLFICVHAKPASTTAGLQPTYPEPPLATRYWEIWNFGPALMSTCVNGTKQIYVNASDPF